MTLIEFANVSKVYQLGERHTTLRQAIASTFRGQAALQSFWALNDVSFRVEPGEALGIIGHNGAGKSTALKLLAGITKPTHGRITISGRTAALIELGAGFHPELSGRENIYLNASFMGLSNKQVNRLMPEIVAFAGLERFIEVPMKRYSSGMYIRLAFAVATHAQADILLIDELLSVGDAAFQQKCMDKMTELKHNGATIVFVSHNLWAVESFCDRALLLRSGVVEAQGELHHVINQYRQYERSDLLADQDALAKDVANTATGEPESPVQFNGVAVMNPHGQPIQNLNGADAFLVQLNLMSQEHLKDARLLVRLRRADGVACCTVGNYDSETYALPRGESTAQVQIGPLNLLPDIYRIEAHVVDRRRPIIYASSSSQSLRINGDIHEDEGIFSAPHEWQNIESISHAGLIPPA